MSGSISVIGIGPGAPSLMAPAAREAIEQADIIVGYKTYLQLIAHLVPQTPRESSAMRQEVARVARALQLAQAGRRVALISGGDAGVYGMAGLVYEMLAARDEQLPVQVIPGISAVNAAAALLGAPLMTDYVALSLSDQLTPLSEILTRLRAVAQVDLVIALYNPKGRRRTEPFTKACDILARHRSLDTPVGIVRAAYREGQRLTLTTLGHLAEAEVDMLSIILVGNSRTYVWEGRMITPRGYDAKYQLGDVPAGQGDLYS